MGNRTPKTELVQDIDESDACMQEQNPLKKEECH